MAGWQRKRERERGVDTDTMVLARLTHCFIHLQDVLTMGQEDLLLHKKEDQNKLKMYFSTAALSVLPSSPPSLPHPPCPNSPRLGFPTSSVSALLDPAVPQLMQPWSFLYTKVHQCLQALNTFLAAHFFRLPLQWGSWLCCRKPNVMTFYTTEDSSHMFF